MTRRKKPNRSSAFKAMEANFAFGNAFAASFDHSARGVTQRYIHLDEALVVDADRISERIAMLIETGRRDKNRRRTRNRLAQDKKQSICAA